MMPIKICARPGCGNIVTPHRFSGYKIYCCPYCRDRVKYDKEKAIRALKGNTWGGPRVPRETTYRFKTASRPKLTVPTYDAIIHAPTEKSIKLIQRLIDEA